jgi:hypothetical protein
LLSTFHPREVWLFVPFPKLRLGTSFILQTTRSRFCLHGNQGSFTKIQVWRPNWAWGIKRFRKFWLTSYSTRGAYAFISVWTIWIRWFIGFSCSAIVVIIIGDPSAQIFRWTSHFSGNIDKFKNIFVSC